MYVVSRLKNSLGISSRNRCVVTLSFLLVVLSSQVSFAANEAPQSFTYQGRFMNGAVPLAGTYDIKFEIYAPGGACLLYQEIDQNNNLTTSGGNIALPVGISVGTNYISG